MAALCTGERINFLAQEMAARQQYSQPPVGRLAALIISGIDEHEVSNIAHKLVILAEKSISTCTGIEVLGPAPAPIYFLRNRYRYRLLVKSIKSVLPQPLIRSWLEQLNVPSRIDIKVDIDPYNFL